MGRRSMRLPRTGWMSRWPAGCSGCHGPAITNGKDGRNRCARSGTRSCSSSWGRSMPTRAAATGRPRVTAELRLGLGAAVNRKRVERLMRRAAVQGIYRRRGRKNLVHAATEEDLVRREFTADLPDALWLTDIAEHPTGEESCTAARSWP